MQNHPRVFFSPLLLSVTCAVSLHAANYTCEIFSYNGAFPTGINNLRQTVGTDYSAHPVDHGFFRDSDGGITRIDFPGAKATSAYTINDVGQIAGTYIDITGRSLGFIRNADGSFVTIHGPDQASDVTVWGINRNGDVDGNLGNINSNPTGSPFVRTAAGEYIVYPFVGSVRAINDAGTLIIGNTRVLADGTPLPEYPSSVPSYSYWGIVVDGLNNANEFSGDLYTEYVNYGDYGRVFAFVSSGASASTVVCPGYETDGSSNLTWAHALSDDGVVAGSINIGNQFVGFIATPTSLTPQLQPSLSSFQFASHPVGVSSGPATIYLKNTGNAPIHLPNATSLLLYQNPTESRQPLFAVNSTTCGITLAVGASCSITFTFTPQTGGVNKNSFLIADDSPDGPHEIPLQGIGLTKMIHPSLTLFSFASHAPGTSSGPGRVFLSDSGGLPVTLSKITIENDPASAFSVLETNCPTTIPVGQTCHVSFVFHPPTTGGFAAFLTFEGDMTGESNSVLLLGESH